MTDLMEEFAKQIDAVNKDLTALITPGEKFCKADKFPAVIEKCEKVVGTDLGSFQEFISKCTEFLDLGGLYSLLLQWAEETWQEREQLAQAKRPLDDATFTGSEFQDDPHRKSAMT